MINFVKQFGCEMQWSSSLTLAIQLQESFSYLYHVKRGGSIYDSGIDLEVKQPSRIFLPDRYHVQGDDDRLRKTITTTT